MVLTDRAVLADRKAHPTDKKDILNVMLNAKDKETGLGMTEDNIRRNVSSLVSETFPVLTAFL